MDAAAAPRDLHVVESVGAQLLLLEPRLAEDGVRVRVDEAGREHSAAAVDDLGARVRILEIACGSDRGDPPVAHGDRGVPQNSGIAHLGAAARSRGAGAGDDLRRVDEEHRSRVRHPIR